jgi:hypothetical protein
MPKIFVKFDDANRTVPTVWTYNFFEDAQLLPTGVLKADLKDDTDTPTGVALYIDNAFSNSGGGSSNATAPAGEFPESVLDSAMFSPNGGTGTLRIAGLPSGASYTLQLTGHTSNAARDTLFTVEGVTGEYLVGAAATPTVPVEFTGTVDPDGELIIDVEKTAGGEFYGYINGFILEYSTGPATPTLDSIDTDNDVHVGQTGVIIATTGVDPASVTQTVTLGGEPLTVTGWCV